jgi:hypothetical protein
LDAPFYDALKAEIGKSAADNEAAAESLAVRVGEPLDESLAGPEDALAIGGEDGGADAADMDEGFSAGRRFHREYGGGILHNGNVFTPI